MDQPKWKIWLSHLYEFHIESAPSKINPHLYVSLSKGRYQLSTANAVYSFQDLYENYYDAFQQLDFDKAKIQNVLLLGLGLGSIPFMLESKFGQTFNYTGVEIDEEVIYLAERYTLNQLNSPMTTICADAGVYVETAMEKFDLIAIDLFLDDVIPAEFQQISFLEQVKTLLTPNGTIMYNRLADTKEDIRLSTAYYDDVFQKVFPQAHKLPLRGNWMLLNRGEFLKS